MKKDEIKTSVEVVEAAESFEEAQIEATQASEDPADATEKIEKNTLTGSSRFQARMAAIQAKLKKNE